MMHKSFAILTALLTVFAWILSSAPKDDLLEHLPASCPYSWTLLIAHDFVHYGFARNSLLEMLVCIRDGTASDGGEVFTALSSPR
jgi:hypothetical protein